MVCCVVCVSGVVLWFIVWLFCDWWCYCYLNMAGCLFRGFVRVLGFGVVWMYWLLILIGLLVWDVGWVIVLLLMIISYWFVYLRVCMGWFIVLFGVIEFFTWVERLLNLVLLLWLWFIFLWLVFVCCLFNLFVFGEFACTLVLIWMACSLGVCLFMVGAEFVFWCLVYLLFVQFGWLFLGYWFAVVCGCVILDVALYLHYYRLGFCGLVIYVFVCTMLALVDYLCLDFCLI